MSKVAWIGLGHMGVPMSANLVNAGHTVLGVDIVEPARERARAVGVQVVETVAEAVRDAEVVFTMLQNGDIVTDVLTGADGAFAHMPKGSVAVDCSTTGIDTAIAVNAEATAQGVSFVDAPVSGGVQGAEDGSLTLMLGGEFDAVAIAEPLLKSVGSYIVHVGPSGDGQKMKVVNNAMLGVGMATASETSVLAQRLGLDPEVFYNIVLRSSGDSWAFRTWFPMPGVVATSPSSHGYEPGFMIDLLKKDLHLATALAEESGVRLDVAASAEKLFAEASASGRGEQDCTALALELGLEVDPPS
ncbi:NAD(P)-dependent oxidoreductase [Nocardioides sp. AX2bis]|uniref:NAD(P)-dependent oxidoreductase n=1 Tax=Nocardioides sp. AX2bis TaxID=2653157 RepID=UPI0012F3586D|nr:NAD(P)-dependent oxidoreductase [Nocardioides sp. AX2bis]VXC25934.1 3-hydroxyisobutyrate dehydrogenase [Nocardioides sp. AX2bis]